MWCRKHQSAIADALTMETEIPGVTRKHMESCPECRRFLADSRRLETDLRVVSLEDIGEPSQGFHAGIMAAVHAENRQRRAPGKQVPRRALRLGWVWAGAGAAGILLIFTLTISWPAKPPVEPSGFANTGGFALPLSVPSLVGTADDMGKTLDNRYQAELGALRKDIEAGLDFLVTCVGG